MSGSMDASILPVRLNRYVLLPAFWQGRSAFLSLQTREENPYKEPVDKLAWLLGYDEEAEFVFSILEPLQCGDLHTWIEDPEIGVHCLMCGKPK